MKNDREIAGEIILRPVPEVAAEMGINPELLEMYGKTKAKIRVTPEMEARPLSGKLIMVTAMTPTPAGEGKTTTSIGLADAFRKLGKKTVVALREPSLGPVFGMKGGATGGGYAQVAPADSINLHFTGDIHAVTAAHNLLAAMVDNRLHFDGACGVLDCRRVMFRRVMDMDDRVLRDIVVGIGGPLRGIARETGFDITAASEVMAILCLSKDLTELKERLGRIMVGESPDRQPVFAAQIGATGSMAALLKEALKPNLVQTLEGTPALIHGGPFANIAHGTSSVIATRLALRHSEIVVTESGFGSDLGAEKFFNIVVRGGQIPPPDACVLVATLRALKMHGGVDLEQIEAENPEAIERGFTNLQCHIRSLSNFGVPFVVTLNRFPSDTDREIERFKQLCDDFDVRSALSSVYLNGGNGGTELAEEILMAIREDTRDVQLTYPDELPLKEKIQRVAERVYGASSVAMEGKTARKLRKLEKRGFGALPVCIAKTQYSLSGDEELPGDPKGHTLIVTDAEVSSGAGFVVVFCGDIMTMPGLPKSPAAEKIDITESGDIIGLA